MGKLHKAQSDPESAYRAILIASTELSQVRSSKWKIPVLCLLEYNMAVRAAGTIFGPGLQLWFSSLQEIHHAGDFAEDFLHGKSVFYGFQCMII